MSRIFGESSKDKVSIIAANFFGIPEALASWVRQSINSLEKELGFPRSSISKYNKNVPSMEKIQKIADLLNVSIDQIIGEERDNTNKYYINEETAKTAQEIFENDRVLFDVYRSDDKEKLIEYAKMLKTIRDSEERK